MRIKLKFSDLSANVDQRKVCYLVDKEKCQKVADLCYLIQKRFFNFGEIVSLYHDGYFFPHQESIEVVQENDILEVKIVNHQESTRDDLQRVQEVKKRKRTSSSSTSESDSSFKSNSKCVKVKKSNSSEAQELSNECKKSLLKPIKIGLLPTSTATKTSIATKTPTTSKITSTTTLKKTLPLSQLGVTNSERNNGKQNKKLSENVITSSSDSSSSSSESEDSGKKNSVIKKHANIVTKKIDPPQKNESTKTSLPKASLPNANLPKASLPKATKSSTSSDSSSSSSSDSSGEKLPVKKTTINSAQKFEKPKNSTYMVKTKPDNLKTIASIPNGLYETPYSSNTVVDFKISGLNRSSVSTPNLIKNVHNIIGKEYLQKKEKQFSKNDDFAKIMAAKDKYENTSEILISGESFNESGNHYFSKVSKNPTSTDSSDIYSKKLEHKLKYEKPSDGDNEIKTSDGGNKIKIPDRDNEIKLSDEVILKPNNQTLSKKTERNRRRRLRRKGRRNNKTEETLDNEDDNDIADSSNEHPYDDSNENNNATILFAKADAENDDVITIANQFQCNTSPKIENEKNVECHKEENIEEGNITKEKVSSNSNGEENAMNISIENLEKFPILKEIPIVDSLIAFKELVLSETYTPEMITRKAIVKNVNKSLQTVELLIKSSDEKVRGDGVSDNRFQLQYSEGSEDENQEEESIERNITVNWAGLLEPRLISEPFEF